MTRYASKKECISAWSNLYRKMGVRIEYATFVYTSVNKGSKTFFTGNTYKGMRSRGPIRANVVFAFLFMYIFESFFYRIFFGAKISSFVHTHPQPRPGYTSAKHSPEDLFLLNLPRINAVYVIPYENNDINRASRQIST